MSCEPFATGHTLLHKADPRTKIIGATAFSVAVASLRSPLPAWLALGFASILTVSARLPLRPLAKRLAQVNLFLGALWLIIPISGTSDTTLFGALPVDSAAIRQLYVITLKCNAIVMAGVALLSTSSLFSLAHALAHLKVPSKLVQLFFFSWRYIHLLEEEWSRMYLAAKLRGFRPSTNLHTYHTFAALVGSLLVKSYDRGERVFQAMMLRGFNGTFWLLTHFSMGTRDLALACCCLLAAGGLIGLDFSLASR